jgi:hypothetical protein
LISLRCSGPAGMLVDLDEVRAAMNASSPLACG